jgi:hypothetical protein
MCLLAEVRKSVEAAELCQRQVQQLSAATAERLRRMNEALARIKNAADRADTARS